MNQPENQNTENQEQVRTSDLAILGINMGVFALYTIISVLAGQDALIGMVVLSVIHGFIALIMAIVQRRWIWVLAGLLIPVIGFGTCLSNIHLGHM
jgi:hypothetical protein